jgi:uncharacterized protein
LLNTLYVNRPVINGKQFYDWAKSQGFTNILDPNDLHVTIAYSKKELDWSKLNPLKNNIRITGGKREIKPLGNEGAVVLKFESKILTNRWKQILDAGGSWDWESYQPHITITYNGSKLNLNKIEPYDQVIELGPEKFDKLDENWKSKLKKD